VSKTALPLQILKPLLLWLGLTLFFALVNNTFGKYEILIQAINSALFTIGYYVAYNYLIKPFLYTGKTKAFVLYFLLVIACLSTVSMLSVYQVYILQGNKFYIDNYWNEPVFFTSNYILILLSTSTLLSFRIIQDKRQTQRLLENVEKEKISAELSFLKAQINPHFLFNSLNNILFQIDKTNRDARETLLKFSDMLRYQLYECSSEQVEIEKELQYIRNYIEIQLLRKTDKYDCRLKVSDTVRNFRIAPLLLIPFIENAFKHISNYSSRKNIISINIDCREDEFIFLISNDRDNSGAIEISENKGIGLANVKRRLDLLYANKYLLDISDDENQFTVSLKMNIT